LSRITSQKILIAIQRLNFLTGQYEMPVKTWRLRHQAKGADKLTLAHRQTIQFESK
jgi:hypothetical protein